MYPYSRTLAYLSSYLSRPSGALGGRGTGTYSYPRRSTPYSVPRRGVNPIEQAPSPYQGQDLASALLMQRQASRASIPSTSFESSYDYDPILAKIQALSSQSVANAQTNASQLRKDALIQSGDVPIGRELGIDENTLTAAGQNPESEYAQLQREFAQRQNDLIEAMSSQNLLYGGEYVRNLSELGQGRASAEAGIGSRLREMLSGVDAGVLAAQEQARQQELAAKQALALQADYAGHPIYDPVTGQYIYPSDYAGTDSGSETPEAPPGYHWSTPYGGTLLPDDSPGSNPPYPAPAGQHWVTDSPGNWWLVPDEVSPTGSTTTAPQKIPQTLLTKLAPLQLSKLE